MHLILDYDYESQNMNRDEITDLADDAPWKEIQKNTFTRWCNEHLEVANMRIDALESDFSDGLRLIALIEVRFRFQFVTYCMYERARYSDLYGISYTLKSVYLK